MILVLFDEDIASVDLPVRAADEDVDLIRKILERWSLKAL